MKDIHDVLEVTVYDEDKDHSYEFLGKIIIPLLKIRNNRKRFDIKKLNPSPFFNAKHFFCLTHRWYSLKDKKMRGHAKGDHPRILLEMFFVYNKVRASVRTFNPKQVEQSLCTLRCLKKTTSFFDFFPKGGFYKNSITMPCMNEILFVKSANGFSLQAA